MLQARCAGGRPALARARAPLLCFAGHSARQLLTAQEPPPPAGHYPTYQSAVYGFASAGELRKLRKEAEQARTGLKLACIWGAF